MRHVAVVGGGAAGMMAAGTAASMGAAATLLEKNDKTGKKLYITGKGRCNLTNNTDIPGLISQVLTNPRFLHSAFNAFDSGALIEFFEARSVPLKTERGGRVFPVSDKASDITKALAEYMSAGGVRVELNREVREITKRGEIFHINTDAGEIHADAVIIATGGLSYPLTGSTGDGYKFARTFGHSIRPTSPSLVPLIVSEPWIGGLEGLSLRNVRCTAKINGRIVYEEQGEMMFTDKGITGPVILRASAVLSARLPDKPLLLIDLKPGLTDEQLDTRILRDFSENKNKNFANSLDELLPKRLISTIIDLSGILPGKKVNAVTRAERLSLVRLLKNLPLTPVETAGYKEAIITRGGVDVKEVTPRTLMSKKVAGLFFAGEVLDVDAMTGGYNLQIAFATGRLAGREAADGRWQMVEGGEEL